MKKYNSIIKKKRKKHEKTVYFAKNKLNTMDILFSKSLISPDNSRNEFVLVNYVLKEYNDMKEVFKNPDNR